MDHSIAKMIRIIHFNKYGPKCEKKVAASLEIISIIMITLLDVYLFYTTKMMDILLVIKYQQFYSNFTEFVPKGSN